MNECLNKSHRLVYRLRTISEMWIRNGRTAGTISADHIPGDEVRKTFREYYPFSTSDEALRFTFAYLCLDGKRGIPAPVSFSYFKGDHTMIRDQLADGRNPDDYDRERILWACYMDDPCAKTMISHSVRKKTISIGEQNVFAIAAGQLFSGYVEGSEDDIQSLAALCTKQTNLRIGAGQNSGLGMCEIEDVYTEKILESSENEQEEFVLHLNSALPMFLPSGLYDERPETILSEIEGILNCPSGLTLVDVCRRTGTFYRKNQPEALCTDKGSCMRIRSVTGPVDIAKLNNAWLGDYSEDGYGEIWAEPVSENYYRKMLVLGEDI